MLRIPCWPWPQFHSAVNTKFHLCIKEVSQPQPGCEPKVPGTFKTGYFSTRNQKVPASRCFPVLPKSQKDYTNQDNDTVVQGCGAGLLPWQFLVYYQVLPLSRDSMEALALNFESGSCGLSSWFWIKIPAVKNVEQKSARTQEPFCSEICSRWSLCLH